RARAGDPGRDPRRGSLRPRRNRHRRRPGAGVAIPRVAAGGGDRRGARFRLLRRSGGIPPQSCRTKLTYAPARRRVIERLRMSQTLETRSSGSGSDRLTVGVAARLSRYLQVLTQAKKMGKDRISSQEISDYTNINATQIRRDLSGFGKFGKRGVGYNIDSLLGEIRKILRTQGQHNIALIGAGRLGRANLAPRGRALRRALLPPDLDPPFGAGAGPVGPVPAGPSGHGRRWQWGLSPPGERRFASASREQEPGSDRRRRRMRERL